MDHGAVERYGPQAVALELKRQQFAGSDLQRGEKADVGIGEQLHLARGDVDLPKIGDAGIVRAADQVFVVEREAELSQVAVFPGNERFGLEKGLGKVLGPEEQERMLAIVALPGHRKHLAVVADVDVEYAHAEGEGVDDFGFLQIFVIADDCLGTAVREQAVQAVVGIVVDDVVDALEVLLLDNFLFLEVVHVQAAHLGIVRRVDETAVLAVEGYEGRVVELDAVDIDEFLLFAGRQVEFHQVGEVTRCVHRGVGLVRGRVVEQGRYGTQRILGQVDSLRQGIFPYGGQVLRLVLLFVFFPLVPDFPERTAVHVLELAAEIGAAVGRTVVELGQLVVAVFLGQVIDETGAVKIGVGANLEVHRGALRLETDHREEFVAFIDDAAEIHLVVAAKGATHTAAEPGLHEAGDAFLVPAGCIPTGNGQRAVKCRERLCVVNAHLGAEETPPAQVPPVVFVRHHDVGVLVIEELPVTLARRVDIIRHVQRSHADLDKRTRQRRCSAVAVVFPVCQKQQGRFRDIHGICRPDLPVKRLAVLEHAHHVWDVAREVLVEEHQPGVIRFVLVVGSVLCLRCCRKQQEDQQYEQGFAHVYSIG